jgi:PAS domain-containing protein
LSQSELVHFVRPSADLLFESVAASYKERAIAVVVSGTGSDGAMGVQAIKKMGGTVIVQDKDSAEFSGMPAAAIQTGQPGTCCRCRPELRDKYFEPLGERLMFRSDLRRSLLFGRHDLVQDVPISGLDLLVCPNTLMYFNADTQDKILARFHFALKDTGFLFLGKAEMLLARTGLFDPVDLRYRVFFKAEREHLRERLILLAEAGDHDALGHLSQRVRLRELAFESGLSGQVVLDMAGKLVLANNAARNMFGLTQRDAGRLFRDLELSSRPVELRSLIEQTAADRRVVRLAGVERPVEGQLPQYLDIQVAPLFENGDRMLGITVTFEDVTRYRHLQLDLQRINQELESANEDLQAAHEELETANEERLQFIRIGCEDVLSCNRHSLSVLPALSGHQNLRSGGNTRLWPPLSMRRC